MSTQNTVIQTSQHYISQINGAQAQTLIKLLDESGEKQEELNRYSLRCE